MKLPTRYGSYGGVFAPEALMKVLMEVERAFIETQTNPDFQKQFAELLKNFAGRETPLTHAKNLSKRLKREIYLKREDLLHGGAHKTNNVIGQCLLAKYLGKNRVIAETGAGQHGVATAMVGTMLGLQVEIYMGKIDVDRQASNVARMKLFGAKVHSVTSGSATLKDAINEAMRDWMTHPDDTYYCFGTAAGPHPFPTMVKQFQEIIGKEAREQILNQAGRLPDVIYACVGGGSNAIGIFSEFLADEKVALVGAEADGEGIETGRHAATLQCGTPGVFHGMESYFLQDDDGQITEPHSISAGLDYPGIGPIHPYLKETGRVLYLGATDEEALEAFEILAQEEGIIPAFESAHAVAVALRHGLTQPEGSILLINISGRGDKDLESYMRLRGLK